MTATAAWADKIGRRVIFRYHHGEEVAGVVTSVNDRYVFVRFGSATSSESCDPDMLRLEVGMTDHAKALRTRSTWSLM